MTYRRSYRNSAPRPARWMDLHYAGTCAECGTLIPAGGRGFYDPSDRSVCCTEISCARAHGVTREVWQGSSVSGGWVTELSATRIGGPSPRPAHGYTVSDNRGGYVRVNGGCGCEDFPCCGCGQ